MIPREFSKSVRSGREYLTTGPAWQSFLPSGLFLVAIVFLLLKKEQFLFPFAHSLSIPTAYPVYGLCAAMAVIGIRMILIRSNFVYEIVDRETIRSTTGYIATQDQSLSRQNISGINITYGIVGGLLDYGDMVFYAGDSDIKAVWKWVSRPKTLREFIETPNSKPNLSAPQEVPEGDAAPSKPSQVPPSIFFDSTVLVIPTLAETGIPAYLGCLGEFTPQVNSGQWVERGDVLLEAKFFVYKNDKKPRVPLVTDELWIPQLMLKSPTAGLVLGFREQLASIFRFGGQVQYIHEERVLPILLVPRNEPPQETNRLNFYREIGSILRDNTARLRIDHRDKGFLRLSDYLALRKDEDGLPYEKACQAIQSFRDPTFSEFDIRSLAPHDNDLLRTIQHLRSEYLDLRDKLVHLTKLSTKGGEEEHVTINNDAVKEARTSRCTGFGAGGTGPSTSTRQWEHWVIHGNGTATDTKSGLMWIQAPWGKKWEGTHFTGDSVKVTWPEAAELFGRGQMVHGDQDYAHLRDEDFAAAAYDRGYTHGCCTVQFVGHSDWRLPTAVEMHTLLPTSIKDFEIMKEVFPDAPDYFWSATPKSDAAAVDRFLRDTGMSKRILEIAWKFNIRTARYIDMNGDQPLPLIFVRQT